ncbi:hypothetical protein [Sphingobacterium sp. LRF_L2]|uniref:hypothetical protein n=1 Tax=Sphingobacterium sp. LRF_L2 TaxID=3369421 RepID=UPI003F5F9038
MNFIKSINRNTGSQPVSNILPPTYYEGLRFRINLHSVDYIIRLVREDLYKGTRAIRILVDNVPRTIVKDSAGIWIFEGGTEITDVNFARAIWNSIALRYRI